MIKVIVEHEDGELKVINTKQAIVIYLEYGEIKVIGNASPAFLEEIEENEVISQAIVQAGLAQSNEEYKKRNT